MSNIYLYKFNNYFNRQSKKYDSLGAYPNPDFTIATSNFAMRDGVNTTHTVNVDADGCNYLIVADQTNGNIKSRWFIMDCDNTTGAQSVLRLRRDLVADYKNVAINSPAIINRAMLGENNPLLFNTEGFSFNQIKTREILLQDEYRSRWIYLYMAKNAADKSNIAVAYNPYAHDFDYVVNSISNSVFDGVAHNSYSLRDSTAVEIYARWYRNNGSFMRQGMYKKNYNGYSGFDPGSTEWHLKLKIPYSGGAYNEEIPKYMNKMVKTNDALMDALLLDYHAHLGSGNYMTLQEENFLKGAVGKTIYEQSTGNYYRVSNVVKNTPMIEIKNNVNYNFCGVLTSQISTLFYDGTEPNNNTYNAELEYTTYKATLEVLGNINFTVSVNPSSKATTDDSECNIIAIPLEGFRVQTGSEDPDTGYYPYVDIDGNDDVNLAIARSIAREYGSSVVYDMQILPYSPFPNSWSHGGELDVSLMDSKLYQYVTYQPSSGRSYAGYIFYLPTSNLTFDINQTVAINNFTDNAAINKKISNECDMYRLCSPNFNGMFEFSVAKNNGVSKFNVDMTLKPYNPYIHINPDFKGIYGQDFNDSRGLILGGDFSLPITGDSFVNYELQNKNYQLAFDRQIAHMDFENKQARREAIAGIVGGGLTGGISGGTLGGMAGLGGPASVGIGAATAAISMGAGAIDYNILKKRQAENKDLAIDMFEYNLGNIKALPYSLNKVNPLTYNNKKFPFIEVYEATVEEKNVLLNKITYQSMTVNAIGTIAEYQQSEPTFISASVIRFEGEELDNHISEELYNELAKGVYI